MRKLINKLLTVTLVLTACSGCALDVGLKPPSASERYMLSVATDSQATATHQACPTVSVERPQANAFLNSTGIALIQPNQKVLYFAKGTWATPLPEMMQEAAIRSLNAGQQVSAFSKVQPGIFPDYKLVWSIEDFYARYGSKKMPPTINISFTCWLLDTDTGTTLATSVFSRQRPAAGTELETIVRSFNASTAALLRSMDTWVLSTIQRAEVEKARQKHTQTTYNQ
ncbi:ABC-type transport auxiliary lipoprotein family protein [Halodesulfovibrio spirochaetisodalis]|uniref:ABC-type transport auxiliary lipoprotein component domain-containing protein n=1 Tax=Halodesulfovibrio spirochaetisodalis TaxID=1560234 RepID=A0A1B7XPV5_9BACT|nr:ABC-type transport auxiliary lipoprotein family protein [Halodesulfovibrio spirochaetisodalis]OBQ57547.1 hypothetical protein SP90_00415 [Halodesulfovibrio spirochaetisodalis]